MSEEIIATAKKGPEAQNRRGGGKRVVIPTRTPSIAVLEELPVYMTPDKTTCMECSCFPKEEPYVKTRKITPCLKSPSTLYELASAVVDSLNYPAALDWSVDDVTRWIETDLGLPQYRECILDNHIDGRRLLTLEDPSKLADLNIRNFKHIQLITHHVRLLYRVEAVRFPRGLTLPPRKPLTHCLWFRSRTVSGFGVRENWTRCDVLRRMEIIMRKPVQIDHWDLVWHRAPDYPKVMFARTPVRPYRETASRTPQYKPPAQPDTCREYMTPRKFKIQTNISDSKQYIWTTKPAQEEREELKTEEEKRVGEKQKKKPLTVPKDTKLMPKRISLTGLTGKEFMLAKRKMATPKFLPNQRKHYKT